MATYCTGLNGREKLFEQVLDNLNRTVNKKKHRLFIVDNSPDDRAKKVFNNSDIRHYANFISNQGRNLGTAEAVNIGWKHRDAGEHCVKMDDDCIVNSMHWADELEEAIERDPEIGIIGLKRKDCDEKPDHEHTFYKSHLRMLPHQKGQRWIIVEDVNHVMGTCQMYNARLMAKIGYLYQPRLYGFDDSLAAIRCKVAGMKNCFLSHINIDHIDPGTTDYQTWKHAVSGEDMTEYNKLKDEYLSKSRSIYYNPFL